jgi:Icc-related predicted phosphoesterase
MIRIAAAGDLHFDRGSEGKISEHFEILKMNADFLLLAGDLTQTGDPEEMKVLAKDLRFCPVPTIAVLGNHDYHSNKVDIVTEILKENNVSVLESSSIILNIQNFTIGIAGCKGFGGGFIGTSCADFGEEEMKSFIRHSKDVAHKLKMIIHDLKTDYKIVLLHYSPTPQTLFGEKKEIYPFLGSHLLADAIDSDVVDLVFHGHAHKGIEKGETPGGTPVRNVAQPVIRHPFNFYQIEKNHLSK